MVENAKLFLRKLDSSQLRQRRADYASTWPGSGVTSFTRWLVAELQKRQQEFPATLVTNHARRTVAAYYKTQLGEVNPDNHELALPIYTKAIIELHRIFLLGPSALVDFLTPYRAIPQSEETLAIFNQMQKRTLSVLTPAGMLSGDFVFKFPDVVRDTETVQAQQTELGITVVESKMSVISTRLAEHRVNTDPDLTFMREIIPNVSPFNLKYLFTVELPVGSRRVTLRDIKGGKIKLKANINGVETELPTSTVQAYLEGKGELPAGITKETFNKLVDKKVAEVATQTEMRMAQDKDGYEKTYDIDYPKDVIEAVEPERRLETTDLNQEETTDKALRMFVQDAPEVAPLFPEVTV